VQRCQADLSARGLKDGDAGDLVSPFDEVRVPKTTPTGVDKIVSDTDRRIDGELSRAHVPAPQAVSAFHIDRAEVTVSDYAACVAQGVCARPALLPRAPEPPPYDIARNECRWGRETVGGAAINCVAREQAESYCKWVGKRLPTLAEWIVASHGANLTSAAWSEAPVPKKGSPDCLPVDELRRGLSEGDWDHYMACEAGTANYNSPHGMNDLLSLAEWTSSDADYSQVVLIGGFGRGPIWLYKVLDASGEAHFTAQRPETVGYSKPGLWNSKIRGSAAHQPAIGAHTMIGFRCAREAR
jgi:formylglycine-generating enzyme required for sulfatase activity